VSRTLLHCDTVIVVDDGSTDGTAAAISDLPILLIKNEANQGKAASLWEGMQTAVRAGVLAVITLDADGQHLPEDIPRFIRLGKTHPKHIIIGSRLTNKAAFPLQRYYANKFANFWISWAAGYFIKDSQAGFRLYPATLLKRLNLNHGKPHSFVFESEVLIEAAQHGFRSFPITIPVIYPADARPSHFSPVLDILRITRMVAWRLASRFFFPQGLYRVFIKPRIFKKRIHIIGADGLVILLLSNVVILATGGLFLLYLFRHVYRVAKQTSSIVDCLGYLLVPGMRLKHDTVTQYYASRLDKAREWLISYPESEIIILGGRTENSTISEAQAGMDYLLSQGITESKILIEDHSLHTLENMQKARALLSGLDNKQVILITNRYHLARSQALAKGVGVEHSLCAAEETLKLTLDTILLLFKEAYLLHWYYVGTGWSLWTNNKKMLRRIT
jgi:uncharacterized SAM-binding protein YcdF (DUF218 family)